MPNNKPLIISSWGVKVRFFSDDLNVLDFFLDKSNFYPKTQICDLNADSETRTEAVVDFTVIHKSEGKAIILNKTKRELIVCGKVPDDIPIRQFVWFLQPLFEYLYNLKGLFSLHASVINRKEKGVILLGFSCDGKSTLAGELASSFDFNFFCDERCLVDFKKKEVLTGNRIVGLRKDILSQQIADKLSSLDGIKKEIADDKTFFEVKHEDNPVKISKIFVVQYRPLPLEVITMSDFDAIGYLYGNLTHTIRSVEVIPSGLLLGYPSFDTKSIARKRVKLLNDFIKKEKVKINWLMGTREDLANYISKNV